MITLDDELRRKVTDQLGWDSRIEASRVQIEVLGGKVILSGIVRTLMEKIFIEKDVKLIPGVKSVKNLLQVEYPQDMPGISDEEIQEAVLLILKHNVYVNARNIKVSVNNSIVTLEGTVRSFWERTKAGDTAEDVVGVVAVNNQILVALPEVIPDNLIEADIREALKRTYAVDLNSIQVKVKNGTVSLTGAVPTWNLYFDVEDTAKYTHGVMDVKNYLVVD